MTHPSGPLGGRALEAAFQSARPEMREELPTDYINLLKRVAIPHGTMVLSSALAQEQLTKADLVQLAVTLGVYDARF